MTHITEKNKAWKIAFRKESQRQNAFIKLKECGFNIDNYDPALVNKDNGFLFISTYDDKMIGCWDTLDVFMEKDSRCKLLTYESLIEMCDYKGNNMSEKSNKKVWDPVSRHINRSRTHYLKWDLTKDISIRYHFLHQGNRELEGQFIVKIHSNGSYQLVDRDFAKKMILSYKRELNAPNTEDALVEPDYEITGRLMRCPLTNRIEFHKTIIEMRTMITHFGIDNDMGLKTISYNQDGELCFKENLIIERPIGSSEAHEKMVNDVDDEKLKEAHGLYFSGSREGITSVFVTDSLSAETKAEFMYPNMEVNKRFVGTFKIEDGLRSTPLEEDLAQENLKVVIDNGFGTKDERELKIKVVHQDAIISIDDNTKEAIRFAADEIAQVASKKTREVEMPDYPLSIKP